MSVSLWNYSKECEGKPCCGDCDKCYSATLLREELEWDVWRDKVAEAERIMKMDERDIEGQDDDEA